MLTAPLIRRRAAYLAWQASRSAQLPACRLFRSQRGAWKRRDKKGENSRDGQEEAIARADEKGSDTKTSDGPSLLEQLFPEETKRYQGQVQQDTRPDIPRLPFDTNVPARPKKGRQQRTIPQKTTPGASGWQRTLELQGGQEPTLLLLRHASKSLVEEDFRQLIPQGLHVEGWKLERGHILKVIPVRDLATLEHRHRYYLLFSNPLSANAYQEHVTRLHRLAATHTPKDTDSPIMPPPGIFSDGLDVNAAIASYSLIPPSQKIVLRMLKPPYTPMLEGIIRNQGYHQIVNRRDKSPFEARLTLEGPQLSQSSIHQVLHLSGKDRALSWSGGHDTVDVRLTKWEPREPDAAISPGDLATPAAQRTEDAQLSRDFANSRGIDITAPADEDTGLYKHTPRSGFNDVYIVGFDTKEALQTFVAFWHRRPMDPAEWRRDGKKRDHEFGSYNEEANRDEEAAPVAKVEVLW